MTPLLTSAVLFAALMHATWNSLIKGGSDTFLDSMLMSMVWVLISLLALFVLPIPKMTMLPYLGVSVVFHISYFFLLAKCYQSGELSSVYPIIRGLPPLLVTVISCLLLTDHLSFAGWLGVLCSSCGILALIIDSKAPTQTVTQLSVLTAMIIASYTVIDGLGARASGNSTSFLVWQSLLQSSFFIVIVLCMRAPLQCVTHIKQHWQRGACGGAMSFGCYAIVLWAITKTQLPYVSALRETSVLFASIIAVVYLSEPFRLSRILSCVLITLGIIVMNCS